MQRKVRSISKIMLVPPGRHLFIMNASSCSLTKRPNGRSPYRMPTVRKTVWPAKLIHGFPGDLVTPIVKRRNSRPSQTMPRV